MEIYNLISQKVMLEMGVVHHHAQVSFTGIIVDPPVIRQTKSPNVSWRFSYRKITYFYGPRLPARHGADEQRVSCTISVGSPQNCLSEVAV